LSWRRRHRAVARHEAETSHEEVCGSCHRPTAKPAVTAVPSVAQAAPKAGDAKKTETGTRAGTPAAKEEPKKN
jgi:hypothetical protein